MSIRFSSQKFTPQFERRQDEITAEVASWKRALRPLLDTAAALDNVDLLNALLNLWSRKCLRETAVSDD